MASISKSILILLLALVAVQTSSKVVASSIDSVESDGDDITNDKHIRLRRSSSYLTWCLAACQDGSKYMERFCRALPTRIRGLCWPVTHYAGKPSVINYCKGFCYNNFGDD